MMRKLFACLLLCAVFPVFGQITASPSPPCGKPALAVPVGSNATFNWIAPTANTDGTAIPTTAGITYNLYNVGGPNPVLLLGGITGLSTTRSNLSAGTPCYAITAVVNGAESVLSQTITLLVAEVPAPPKSVSCSITLPANVTGPTPTSAVCTVQ